MRGLFQRFCILTLAFEYVFALMTLIVNNYEIFQSNSEVYKVINRLTHDLHRQIANRIVYQKRLYYHYAPTKLYNKLAIRIKRASNKKRQFQLALKEFYLSYTFYSVDGSKNYYGIIMWNSSFL